MFGFFFKSFKCFCNFKTSTAAGLKEERFFLQQERQRLSLLQHVRMGSWTGKSPSVLYSCGHKQEPSLEVSVPHRLLLAHPSLAILTRRLGANQHILQPHLSQLSPFSCPIRSSKPSASVLLTTAFRPQPMFLRGWHQGWTQGVDDTHKHNSTKQSKKS